MPGTEWPALSFGVWQLPQVPIVVTRYAPRSSNVSAEAATPIPASSAAPQIPAAGMRIFVMTRMISPLIAPFLIEKE
jgi:hypothetical protein